MCVRLALDVIDKQLILEMEKWMTETGSTEEKGTVAYLTLMHKIFVLGFLSHDKVTGPHDAALANLREGLGELRQWHAQKTAMQKNM